MYNICGSVRSTVNMITYLQLNNKMVNKVLYFFATVGSQCFDIWIPLRLCDDKPGALCAARHLSAAENKISAWQSGALGSILRRIICYVGAAVSAELPYRRLRGLQHTRGPEWRHTCGEIWTVATVVWLSSARQGTDSLCQPHISSSLLEMIDIVDVYVGSMVSDHALIRFSFPLKKPMMDMTWVTNRAWRWLSHDAFASDLTVSTLCSDPTTLHDGGNRYLSFKWQKWSFILNGDLRND